MTLRDSIRGSLVDKSTANAGGVSMELLSDYQSRKLDQRCIYPGCDRPPADGAAPCQYHLDAERRRKREWMRAARKRWKAANLCTRCGRKRKPGSKWGCSVCVAELIGFVDGHVDKSARIAANTTERTTASNLGRVHYHGKGKRGAMTKAEADGRDFDEAIRLAARAKAEHDYAVSPEVAQLPPIQRADELEKAIDTAARGLRHLASILRRHRVNIVQLAQSCLED